jgi:hypothetical protein
MIANNTESLSLLVGGFFLLRGEDADVYKCFRKGKMSKRDKHYRIYKP